MRGVVQLAPHGCEWVVYIFILEPRSGWGQTGERVVAESATYPPTRKAGEERVVEVLDAFGLIGVSAQQVGA